MKIFTTFFKSVTKTLATKTSTIFVKEFYGKFIGHKLGDKII